MKIPYHILFLLLVFSKDWLPTIAELTGLMLPNSTADRRPLDGKSQLQGLRYGYSTRDEIHLGYAHVFGSDSWFGPGIRFQNWKLIQGSSSSGCSGGGPDQFDTNPTGSNDPLPGGLSNSTYWLFDLETDPLEETNLVDQYPSVAEDLICKLRQYQQGCVPFQSNDDSECPFTGVVNTSVGPTW